MDRNEAFKILYDVWRRTGLGTEQSRERRRAFEIALGEMLELDGCRYPDDQIRAEYPSEALAVDRAWERRQK